jgi:predicted nucleic acid-binding protein
MEREGCGRKTRRLREFEEEDIQQFERAVRSYCGNKKDERKAIFGVADKMRLTIDSDALAYAFIEPTKAVYKERYEEFKKLHDRADSIYKDVIRGIHELIIPSTVLIEVPIVISRALGEEIAKEVYARIKNDATEIIYLTEKFTRYCMETGVKTHLSGFDTVVLASAMYANSTLLTNDKPFFLNVRRHHPEIKAYLLREVESIE